MKLYIPILDSNIDNILTSESISPHDFYSKRDYGYNSFDNLPDNPSNNILLYSELGQCPSGNDIIYIQVEDSALKESKVKVGKDIYSIKRTIELPPWDTKILFTTPSSFRKAVSFCNGSLNNKLWQYYEFCLIDQKDNNKLRWSQHLETPNDNGIEPIKQDQRNNRLKGFLFGYLVGQSISLSPDLAMLRKYAKQISDLCTVIPTMRAGFQTGYIAEVNRLKSKYNDCNPRRKELQKVWKEDILARFSSDEDRLYFKELTSRYKVLRAMMDSFAKEKGISTGPSVVEATQRGNWREFKEQFDSYTTLLIKEYKERDNGQKNATYINISVDKNNIHCSLKPFYEELINSLINGDTLLCSENIVSNRQDVATKITLKIKDSFINGNEDWEKSKEYNYYNKLRQSINTSNGFDPSIDSPDDMATALAIYLLRCDDFEDMIRFAIACGFGRYDLLLGLWGANKGYVDLPKTIFSYMNIERQYIERAYAVTYQLMHPSDNVQHKLITMPHKIVEVVPEVRQEGIIQERSIDLPDIIKKKELKFSKEQQVEIIEIYEHNNHKIDHNFFHEVAKIKNVGKTKISRLKEALHYGVNELEAILSLNKPQSGERILVSSDWEKIKEFCGADTRSIMQIHRDFDYFLKNRSQYNRTVDKYIRYVKDRKYKNIPNLVWLAPFYKDVDIDSIYKALKVGPK